MSGYGLTTCLIAQVSRFHAHIDDLLGQSHQEMKNIPGKII